MDGFITIGTELDTKQFDKQILELERKVNDLEKITSSPKDIGLTPQEVHEVEVELEKTRNKLVGLYKQKMKLEQPTKNNVFAGFNSSLDKAIRKASKLALGIFGIRSAYMMLRRASSELAGYDEQYATNLEYISFVLTQAVAPILRYIVNLAGTLLQYINEIAQAWFGVNLFANGSVEAFNKMKKGATGVGKAVKEIRKQLLGFDEINVLTDQSETGTSAGAGGVSPSFDVGGLGENPKWLDWIIQNKDLAIKGIEGIATAILTLKYGLGLLKGVGLFLIIDGIVDLIKNIKEFSKNPSIKKFADILYSMGEAVTGLGIAFSNTPLGLIGLLAIAIGDVVTAIGDLFEMVENPTQNNLIKFLRSLLNLLTIGRAINGIIDTITKWLNPSLEETTQELKETEKAIKSVEEAEEDLREATDQLLYAQDRYENSINRLEEANKELEEAQERTGISGQELFEQVKQGTISYMNMTSEQKEVYRAYLETKSAEENLKQATDELTKAEDIQRQATNELTKSKQNEKVKSLEAQFQLARETGQYDEYKKAVVEAFRNGEISADQARDLIGQALDGISEDGWDTFIEDLPNEIAYGLDPNNYVSIASRFRNWWNSLLDSLRRNLNLYITGNFSVGGGGRRRRTAEAEVELMEEYSIQVKYLI